MNEKRYYAVEGAKIGFVTGLVPAILGLFSGDVNSYYFLGVALILIIGSVVGALSSIIINYIDKNREPGAIVGMIAGMSMVVPQIIVTRIVLGVNATPFNIGGLVLFGIIGLIVGAIMAGRRK